MKILRFTLISALFSAAALAEPPGGNAEAYSRIFRHRDGTRTESFKNGNKNEIQEFTYNKNNILQYKRVFVTDSKGRSRAGYIFDAKQNPKGSIAFGYDSETNQLVEERQFNERGQLVRRLFYPGALKGAYGNRFVALNYDPNNPAAKPVQAKEAVRPTKPVESDQDEFEPGIPIGKSAPASNSASSSSSAPAPAPSTAHRKRYFASPGSAAPAVPAPAPQPPPPPAAAPVPAVPDNPPAAPMPAPRRAPAHKPQT